MLARRPRLSPPRPRLPLARRRFRLSFLLAFLAAAPGRAQTPQPAGVEFSSGTRLLSPAVVATVIVRKEPQRTSQLDLLVLWRGNPGWFMQDGSDESSHGSIQSGGSHQEAQFVTEQVSFGGLRLDLKFDREKRTVRVQDHDVALKSANVILVNEVDGASGPQVTGTLEVDPAFPSEPAEIEAIVRRSPEVYAFLLCDASVPDAHTQTVIETLRARMKPN